MTLDDALNERARNVRAVFTNHILSDDEKGRRILAILRECGSEADCRAVMAAAGFIEAGHIPTSRRKRKPTTDRHRPLN
jgi:hypothetical protein